MADFDKRLMITGLWLGSDLSVSEYLAAIGKKGGQAKVPKGLALLSAEKRKAIAAKGLV